MSKISYCSIEEAWGTSFDKKNDLNEIPKDNNNDQLFNRNKYEMLNEKSKTERESVINNMNNIERNSNSENNMSIQQYNKYRFNPNNKVSNNTETKDYTPFSDSIEKKQLKDKLDFLENEFKKYKYMTEPSKAEEYKENFQNENGNGNDYQKNNDFVDLMLLIIIGLIVILVLNSIFNIGKVIGARSN